jgi:class 3 adenylate cyclase
MAGIEDLLRRRGELVAEIDQEILRSHTREVTLLFTDIVGSTAFYSRWGDITGRQMVLVSTDLLFPLIGKYEGRIIKTIGDSIMAAFDRPDRAVDCTVAMQRAIVDHNATATASLCFQVRMGLHHGTAVLDDRDVFGDAVNTAARVETRANGGEILLTGAVRDKLESPEPGLVFVGRESIRGREDPVDLYQVDWQGLGEREIRSRWVNRRQSDAVGVSLGPLPDLEAERAALPPVPTRGNPYLNRVMIPHPGLFVGRRALVRKILGRLGGTHPQSLSIVGERRTGKPSLINYLRSPQARIDWLEDPGHCFFVLLDFQQTRALTPGKVALFIGDALRAQTGMSLEGSEDLGSLRRVGDAVAAAHCRIVLLCDEFEAVTRNPGIGPDFYAFLRSLANTLPVSFVCTSGRPLKDLCVTHEIADSPFFNIFSEVRLGLFDQADAEELVREPSAARGLPLEALGEALLSMGGRHPFFLPMACSAWYEFLETEGRQAQDFVGQPVPAPVLDQFREESRPHFEYVVESLPEAEAEVLLRCQKTPPDSSLPEVKSLVRRGYLVPHGGSARPFSEEFEAFLRG